MVLGGELLADGEESRLGNCRRIHEWVGGGA